MRRPVPDVVELEDAVLLRGYVAARLGATLAKAADQQRRGGVPLDERLVEAVEALGRVGKAWKQQMSGSGHSDMGGVDIDASSSDATDLLTADAAGELLDCTSRHVRRLANKGELPGGRVGGQWMFDRADVADLKESRDE